MTCGRLERCLRLLGGMVDIPALYHPRYLCTPASTIITRMKKWLKTQQSALLILSTSFFLTYPLVCRVYGFFERPLTGKLLVFLTLWAGITGALWLFTLRFDTFSSRRKPALKPFVVALFTAITMLFVFHWQPPAFPSTFQINIQADTPAKLIGITAGGKSFALDHFKSEGDWSLAESGWHTEGNADERLMFSGSVSAPIQLTFATGPEFGSATVTWQNHPKRVDLYTPQPDTTISQPFPGSYGSVSMIWTVWVGLLLVCEFLLLTGVFFLLFSRYPYGTAAFLIPFLFLLPYVTTISGHNVSLGNDFGPFYYVYKAYLLDFLSQGIFPMWSPSEAAGFPFFSNPLAQAFYPANVLLAFFYNVNDGYTRLDHQVFTITAIAWFSLGLFVWLRSLRVENRHALFAALVMALSYKMTELLRFPNAAHEAAWYPWIFYTLTRMFTAQTWKSVCYWSAGLGASLICLFTAGYPYYVYYLPFLAGPYMLFMLIPAVRTVIFGIEKPNWRKFLTGFSAASAASLLTCGPYLFHMAQTIELTAGRAGDDFIHATMYPFDFLDTLESLVYPVAARPEGWFYFGALPMSLIILFLCRPQRVVAHEDKTITTRRAWQVKTALVLWLVFLSYISYGDRSYLYLVFYKVLPGFSALRGWGRLSIALLPGLALLLAFALADLESRWNKEREGSLFKPYTWLPLIDIAIFSLGFQLFEFSRSLTDEYWDIYFIPRTAYLIQTAANVTGHEINLDRSVLSTVFSYSYMIFSLLAVFILAGLLWRKRSYSVSRRNWILALLGLFSLVNLWYGGPWLWNNGFASKENREPGNYARLMPVALKTPRKNENSTLTLSPAFSVGSPPKWHYSTYQDFYFDPQNASIARDELLGVIDGRRFFFSSSIDQNSIDTFLMDTREYDIKPEIIEYTGDFLQMNLSAASPGYISFIDNLDTNWIARVDGEPLSLKPLFGTFKSLRLDAGEHEIIMAYCPRLFEWANPVCTD